MPMKPPLMKVYTTKSTEGRVERKGIPSMAKPNAQAAKAAGIEFPVDPHMLRHATGFYLANAGQDTRAIQLYLGHKNIQHTVRYTELDPERFQRFRRA